MGHGTFHAASSPPSDWDYLDHIGHHLSPVAVVSLAFDQCFESISHEAYRLVEELVECSSVAWLRRTFHETSQAPHY